MGRPTKFMPPKLTNVTFKVKMVTNNLPALAAGLKALNENQVLVGVPAQKSPRKGDPINNAALAWIHNFGFPTLNIPARPFMAPGIENAKTAIRDRMERAAKGALAGNNAAVLGQLNAVGIVAASSIKTKIQQGPFVALKPSTLAARRRKGRKGTRPLIDTAQMLGSITYVIRPKGKTP